MAVVVLLLLLSFALPHTGSANAWDVLVHDEDAVAESVALPSRIFVWLTLVFAVGFSALALVTQRWALAWVALYGSGVATVLGILAIWSRQTVPVGLTGAGPGWASSSAGCSWSCWRSTGSRWCGTAPTLSGRLPPPGATRP